MPVLLDTHVWVWWLSGSEQLSSRERTALDALAGDKELHLSTISLWEVQIAYEKRRFQPDDAFETWLREAASPEAVQLVQIDLPVALALNALPRSLPRDPADRLIVATARAHAMPLATHDTVIRRSRAARLWRP